MWLLVLTGLDETGRVGRQDRPNLIFKEKTTARGCCWYYILCLFDLSDSDRSSESEQFHSSSSPPRNAVRHHWVMDCLQIPLAHKLGLSGSPTRIQTRSIQRPILSHWTNCPIW